MDLLSRPRPARFLSLLPLAAIAACGGGGDSPAAPQPVQPPPPPPPAAVATVTVAPGGVTLVASQTAQLTAETRDGTGALLSGRAIAWASSAQAVATVSATGEVTAVAPGTASVIATSEGRSGTATITVAEGGLATPSGASISAMQGSVRITVPAGAVASTVPMIVTAVAQPPAHPRLVPGSAVQLGPDGATFATPVTVALRWQANQLAAGAFPGLLRVHRHDGTQWVPLADATVDTTERSATGRTSAFSTFALIELPPNPAPTLTALAPATATAGAAGLTVTLTGTGFVPTSGVRWNGSPRPTTFVSATTLRADIPASDLLAAGTAQVTVVTPAPGGGTSAAQSFVVTPPPLPTPVLSSIAPATAVRGSNALTLTATGTGFTATSVIRWNGADRPTTFVSATTLTAAIPASDLAVVADVAVTVFTPAPGGGTSSARTFAVTAPPPPGPPAVIAAGSGFTCGLMGSAAYCWGSNVFGGLGNGESEVVSGVPTRVAAPAFTTMTSGMIHSCALTAGGAAWCWGNGSNGQIGNGPGGLPRATPVPVSGGLTFVSIVAGSQHSCGLTASGAAWCWGDRALGNASITSSPVPVPVSGGKQFTALAAGSTHTCGLAVGGAAWCWGSTFASRLGIGSASGERLEPVLVSGGHLFVSISANENGTCAVKSDGAAWCWGSRLGDGSSPTTTSNVPRAVSGGLVFASVSVGRYHSCGITVAGAAWCWGSNSSGSLGTGSSADNGHVPVPVAGGHLFESISLGAYFACGRTTTGTVLCWGSDSFSVQANGPGNVSSPVPVPVTSAPSLRLSAGSDHICGLTTLGETWCWGSGQFGQLGDGRTNSRYTPEPVIGGLTFAQLDAGPDHTCGVTTTGAAHCWGLMHVSGTGGMDKVPTPTAVPGGHSFSMVSAGDEHSCGVTPAGAAWCWGQGSGGELGFGGLGIRTSPVAVAGGHQFVSVAAGNRFSCGITTTHQAWCWGVAAQGQLGRGVGSSSEASPVAVAGGHQFKAIGAGEIFACALRVDGAAMCWGLILPSTSGAALLNSAIPVLVPGNRTYSSLSVGANHACALTAAGAAWCWGVASGGRLGAGATGNSFTPVPVSGGHAFTSISAGSSHTCAISTASTAWCWGAGGARLGNGSTEDALTPVQVSAPAGAAAFGWGRRR